MCIRDSPGLVDIHFHGCAGHDFSDGTPEALQAIGAYELCQGVTSICPASMTLSEETLKTVCANAYAYTKRPEAEQDTGARLIGIHLEGPFISMEKKLSLIHISEPTRLGMISYAVFCLKKKNVIKIYEPTSERD